MSEVSEPIKVPTNGRKRAPAIEPAVAPEPAPAPLDVEPAVDHDDDGVATRIGIAFSPGQLAIGFGVIAGLILFVAGRRRRRDHAG